MKASTLSIAAALVLVRVGSAFVPSIISSSRTAISLNAVEVMPEPEGGKELTPIKTIGGSKLKNMGVAENVNSDDGVVYKFWLQTTAEGTLVKELNTQVLKDASKKANFPGFRKGQIPPYAMPQIRGFALQEGIIQTVQSAVDAYGLKSISGSDGEVEILEDIPEMAKSYKVGDNVDFTATFQAVFDPELVAEEEPESADSESTVIDVEVEAEGESSS